MTQARQPIHQQQNPPKQSDGRYLFEVIILPHRAFLYHVAVRLTRDTAEAEDLVQKTLVRAFTRWHTFHNEKGRYCDQSLARAWLKTILRRIFISDLREQTGKSMMPMATGGFCFGFGPLDGDSPLPSLAATPERTTIHREECQAIRRAMQNLPEHYGAVITLIVEDGLPYEEVATRLNLPLGTVRSRLHRARKRLQKSVAAWQ